MNSDAISKSEVIKLFTNTIDQLPNEYKIQKAVLQTCVDEINAMPVLDREETNLEKYAKMLTDELLKNDIIDAVFSAYCDSKEMIEGVGVTKCICPHDGTCHTDINWEWLFQKAE